MALSAQLERKIHTDAEPTVCDQCGGELPIEAMDSGAGIVTGYREYFVSAKNWSGVAMVYCRGCEDRRAEKFDEVHDCTICGDVVVEDDIVWYNAESGRLDTDKGEPYCVGCVPKENEL